jgi:hypothetical protein
VPRGHLLTVCPIPTLGKKRNPQVVELLPGSGFHRRFFGRLFCPDFAFFPLGGGFTVISPRMASSKSASMIGGLGLVAEIIIITVSSSLLGVKRLQM